LYPIFFSRSEEAMVIDSLELKTISEESHEVLNSYKAIVSSNVRTLLAQSVSSVSSMRSGRGAKLQRVSKALKSISDIYAPDFSNRMITASRE
jgi:hypothetical protein